MIFSSSARDFWYEAQTSALTYYIEVDGNPVYWGKVVNPSGNARINIGRRVSDYLDTGMPDFRDFNGVVVPHPSQMRVFNLRDEDSVLLGSYTVLLDADGSWDGEYGPITSPVNGHTDPRQKVFLSFLSRSGETYVVTMTSSFSLLSGGAPIEIPASGGSAQVWFFTSYNLSDIYVKSGDTYTRTGIAGGSPSECGILAYYQTEEYGLNLFSPRNYYVHFYRRVGNDYLYLDTQIIHQAGGSVEIVDYVILSRQGATAPVHMTENSSIGINGARRIEPFHKYWFKAGDSGGTHSFYYDNWGPEEETENTGRYDIGLSDFYFEKTVLTGLTRYVRDSYTLIKNSHPVVVDPVNHPNVTVDKVVWYCSEYNTDMEYLPFGDSGIGFYTVTKYGDVVPGFDFEGDMTFSSYKIYNINIDGRVFLPAVFDGYLYGLLESGDTVGFYPDTLASGGTQGSVLVNCNYAFYRGSGIIGTNGKTLSGTGAAYSFDSSFMRLLLDGIPAVFGEGSFSKSYEGSDILFRYIEIPKTVQRIEKDWLKAMVYNKNFQIAYEGTISEFGSIEKEDGWNGVIEYGVGRYSVTGVTCSDGVYVV